MGDLMSDCNGVEIALMRTDAPMQTTGCTSASVACPPKGGHTLELIAPMRWGGEARFNRCAAQVASATANQFQNREIEQ